MTVNVTAPVAGTYNNTTTAVSATTAGKGLVSNTAQLTVSAPVPALDLRKEISTSATGPWTKFLTQVPGSPVFSQVLDLQLGGRHGDVAQRLGPDARGHGGGSGRCSWPASLAPGNTASCIVGSPTSIPAALGSNPNTATAGASYLGGPVSSNPNSASYLGAPAGFSLLKQIGLSSTGPWFSSLTGVAGGADLYYKFTVVNTGGIVLSSVNITDALVSTVSCAFTDPLAPGGVTVCVVGPVTASSTPGTYTNTATAHGTTPSLLVVDTLPSSASYSTGVVPHRHRHPRRRRRPRIRRR